MLPLAMDQRSEERRVGKAAVLPVEPAHTAAAAGVIVGVAGFALTVTLALFVAEQPAAFVTVRVSVVVPATPAVQVTVCDVCPPVMLPLVIDHEYVVAPPGPLAVLPVEPAHTAGAAGVIVGVAGFEFTVTSAVFVAEQPAAFVTVSVSVVVPAGPAVHVTVCAVCPPVMLPLVMDQK